MADFPGFLDALLKELAEFASYSWRQCEADALKDAKKFVLDAKADLQRWTDLLAEGKLTRADFEWLVASKKDLAELAALKRKGLATVALDRFVNGVIDTIVALAFKYFPTP